MRATRFAFALALLAALVLLASGPGVRLGLWPFGAGLLALLAAGLIGLAAVVLAIVGLARGGGAVASVLALILGALVLSVPAAGYLQARSLPPINDISTDSLEQSAQQRAAYPDIRPLQLAVTPNVAFERARGAAEDMGWRIVRADPAAGRLEAVASTFWFGFKDDVAIRVSAQGSGSRIDIRSRSRVGKGDLGTNARRIREFRQRME